jgi:hypothetical protein
MLVNAGIACAIAASKKAHPDERVFARRLRIEPRNSRVSFGSSSNTPDKEHPAAVRHRTRQTRNTQQLDGK